MKKVLSILVTVLFIAVGCDKNVKKEQTSFKISGMTCEIGCAKKIESDLSKKEGVISADVNFKESLATIEYDANKTSKEDLMKFVNGIADGKTYKTCNIGEGCDAKKPCNKGKKSCDVSKKESDSLKRCDGKATKCSEECKKACAKGDPKSKETCNKECNTKKAKQTEGQKQACACKKEECCSQVAENANCDTTCKAKCCEAA